MTPSIGEPDATVIPDISDLDSIAGRIMPPVKAFMVIVAVAACIVFVLSVTATAWSDGLEQQEWFRWIADTVIDFLQRFYHEPEMDIVEVSQTLIA